MADSNALDLAASRMDGLRFVLPGAYATSFVLLAVDATNLRPFRETDFRTEWLVVSLLVAFLLGYILHLLGMRFTRYEDRKAKAEAVAAKKRTEEEEAASRNRRSDPGRTETPTLIQDRPRGPHDAVNVLLSNSTLFWTNVRPMVIAKFNELTGQRIDQAQLDKHESLRWFVYHYCFSYALKTGAAAEAQNMRGQFDLVRAFRLSLWFGFAASLVAASGLAVRAFCLGPPHILWESPMALAIIGIGIAAPLFLGGLMREQQDRASKRLAGAVYEGFLAA